MLYNIRKIQGNEVLRKQRSAPKLIKSSAAESIVSTILTIMVNSLKKILLHNGTFLPLGCKLQLL
ncbi:hypothetical protein QUC31_006643 [Theobroma cacao]